MFGEEGVNSGGGHGMSDIFDLFGMGHGHSHGGG